MITYFYWFIVIAIAIGVLVFFAKMEHWKPALIGCAAVLLVGSLAYYFHFQQVSCQAYPLAVQPTSYAHESNHLKHPFTT